MSSRRKRSRLAKTDVATICEMQRKIDAYESYIIALAGHSSMKKETKKYVVLFMGTDMDGWVQDTWNNIQKMKDDLKEKNREGA